MSLSTHCTPTSDLTATTTMKKPRIPLLSLLLSVSSVPLAVHSRDCHTRWRRAWRDLTCQQQDEFLEAIIKLKESGTYDEFRYTHEYYGNLTHGTPEFLPWHRWFLYQLFEKALQQVTGQCIYVPYWDWERDSTQESESTVFHPDTFGSFGKVAEGTNCTEDGRFNSTKGSTFEHASFFKDLELDCLQRDFREEVHFTGESQLLGIIASFEQYGDTTDSDNEQEANGFRTIVEGIPHAFSTHFTRWSHEYQIFTRRSFVLSPSRQC
jgi:Common central domain of tyrosinase